jgi:aldehyde:ferredoxin oxidoreductase
MSDQCGWAGKILRVNLTEGTFSSVDTMKYVPKYVGGMGVAHRIWWEEMRPGVKAFDPENKLIFTTGVTTGSAAPSGGRGEFVSISPYSYPEQYTNSSIGGAFPTQLKWLGYDGIILEGKAPEPSYLLITDKGPELKPAPDLWGMGLVDAQKVLFDRHGEGTVSYGIGPAGENLVRFAIIGCGIHSATGQGGMGAVMGSKNLKAITLTKGKHQVRMADPEALLQVTKDIFPEKANHPWIEDDMADKEHNPFWWSWVGPNEKPNFSINWMGNMYNKPYAYLSHSCGLGCLHGCGFYELRNVPATTHPGLLHAMTGCNHTRYEQFFHKEEGDKWAKGFEIHELAEQLGFGHFEIVYGIVPWLYYTKAVGIDTESLVGMPTDVRSVEWWTRLLNMIAYRRGFGDQLAEGLRRTVEELGAEKYADTMYEGPEAARGLDHPSGKEVKLPVAVLHGWGYTARSLGTEMPFPMNLPSTLNWMIDTRDPHHNKWPDWAHKEFGAFVMKAMTRQEDPYSAEFPLRWAKLSTIRGTLIDCLPVCFMFPLRNYMGWKFGDREVGEGTWTTAVESRIFSAVTGIQTSEADLFKAGERVNTLFRAIQIRDHERTAQMEFDEIMPRTYGTYDAEKFKVTTGNFYEYMGWDRETGWPTREHLEALDLKDVADELEALGKLPKMASVAA